MEQITITSYKNQYDIKSFNIKNWDLELIHFKKDGLLETKKKFSKHSSANGIYIIEINKSPNLKKEIYVGQSTHVWSRIKNHVEGKHTPIKNYKYIDCILVILATHEYKLNKTSGLWLEEKLISRLNLSNEILIINTQKHSSLNIHPNEEEGLNHDIKNIEKALYHFKKNYLLNISKSSKTKENKIFHYVRNHKFNQQNKKIIKNTNLIEIFPILYQDKQKRAEVKGTFKYNVLSKKIRVYKGAFFSGVIRNYYKIINDKFQKYKSEGFLEGKINFQKYRIKVVENFEIAPSSMTIFTRGHGCNGWYYWKDKDNKIINEYRKDKNYLLNKLQKNKISHHVPNYKFSKQNKNLSIKKQNLIEVFPILHQEINLRVKVKGSFKYNVLSKKIRVYKGAFFSGIIRNAYYKELNNQLQKYKSKGVIEGEMNSQKYNIKVIETFELAPSSMALFTLGLKNNGWFHWKDKNNKMINEYRN